MIAAALAGHVLQARPSFNLEKIQPDFSKLSLTAGLKRMFGLDGWMNLLKGLLKIGVVASRCGPRSGPSGTCSNPSCSRIPPASPAT